MPEGWPADQPCQIAGLMAVDPAEVLDRVEAMGDVFGELLHRT